MFLLATLVFAKPAFAEDTNAEVRFEIRDGKIAIITPRGEAVCPPENNLILSNFRCDVSTAAGAQCFPMTFRYTCVPKPAAKSEKPK